MPDFLPVLIGCFAQPVAENPTVVMMEAAFRHHGIHARYINMEVSPENLASAVVGAKAQGYLGFNCSLPHKVAIISHLDCLGQSAAITGAVNCAIRQPDGLWRGENTDGKGFLQSLLPLANPAGQHAVIFGAGGAARAIATELALAGARQITLVNRSPGAAAELAQLLTTHTATLVATAPLTPPFPLPPDASLVVNATSVGLFPNAAESIPVTGFAPHMTVADVIPNPPRTTFLDAAHAAGCQTLDGLGMLVNQGALNLSYWFGIDPDRSVMRTALSEVFAAEPRE
jgi:shikimate dehydrogenase